jgi:hypothetical protein
MRGASPGERRGGRQRGVKNRRTDRRIAPSFITGRRILWI